MVEMSRYFVRFCLGGGGGGGGGGRGVNFGHAKSAVKKNSFVYVSMRLIFLLDNCLTMWLIFLLDNCLTRLHPYIHTYRHHSDQISRSAWTARLIKTNQPTILALLKLNSVSRVSEILFSQCRRVLIVPKIVMANPGSKQQGDSSLQSFEWFNLWRRIT